MNSRRQLVIYGEVLFDCFPDGRSVLGGAPFNVAWHCQAFGLQPLLISRVGHDEYGDQIKAAMRGWNMSIDGLQTDEQYPTGKVQIAFVAGEPQYEIVENSAWDFISADELPWLSAETMLYHGSLALRSQVSAATLAHLKRQLHATIFIDINLRTPWWNPQQVENLIADAQILKLNENELDLLGSESEMIEDKIKQRLTRNPLDWLIMTRGEKGVVAADFNQHIYTAKPEPAEHVVDTVGAGDSFSSVLLLGQYLQWPIETTLQRAQQFASEIVGIQGATINDKNFYQTFIDEWNLPG